ncbi:DNA-binding protein [Pseudomonas sp. GD03842]|uniref:DNA-binding protein n=1 Tax=Pseudomonas sp. GD03842 TaxID=2975385 RepID=UPI00244A15CA|nr:DNA-binding protein [Pseudomonas sp. GD03842]MDH0744904.1 DNA-binding protein [Pseudomonas sp. GD03842]
MARSGITLEAVRDARSALIAKGENPSIDAVRIALGNTGSKSTIHRLMRELDATSGTRTSPSIDDELTALVSRLSDRLRGQAQEHIDAAKARLDAEKKETQDALHAVQRQLADLIDRHAAQTTKLGTQTATLLSTQQALQKEQKENARLTQAALDTTSRIQDKEQQVIALKAQHLQAHTQCALLEERLSNARQENDRLKAQLTERDQQNRVLELILIKTEVALENARAGHAASEPDQG